MCCDQTLTILGGGHMNRIFPAILFLWFLTGCSAGHNDWTYTPPPDQGKLDDKAHSDFLQKAIVKDFAAEGILLDCEPSICANITGGVLNSLSKSKAEFVQRKDRIHKVMLVKEDYPIYDYRLDGAYVPAQLTDAVLNEFFDVLSTIHDFENQVGFRIEFPNNHHLHRSIDPLLAILKNNAQSLKAEAKRIDLLVISSVYNQFYPNDKVLMLKIDDLKKSCDDQWKFMSIFFKAQDLFGDVAFTFDFGDNESAATMDILFNASSKFAPLFSKLQGRRITFLNWNYRGYSDAHGFLMDLAVSNVFDEKYLLQVMQDQVRVVELSKFIGKRISHTDSIIEIDGHDTCLDKLDHLKTNLKEKIVAINSIEVGWGKIAPSDPSSFSQGKLFLNCNQQENDLRKVIEGIQ